jgi:glycosyltransferase involved in cell wall biosynthesis
MRTINVSFDEQTFILQKEGGIPRYFTELIREFQCDPSLGCNPRSQAHFGIANCAADAGLVRRVPGPERVARRIAYAMNSPWRASSRHADLIHRTYYHPRFLPEKSDPPTVFTIYDFIPEEYPELFPGGHPHMAKAEAIRRASGLICISNHSRDALLEHFPGIDAHVSVAPLGVAEFWFEDDSELDDDESVQGAYLLYVGRRDGYKDFDVLLDALSGNSLNGLELVVAGGGSPSRVDHELVQRLGLESRVRWVAPTDVQLRALYRNAVAFVFPSRLEGFGLPTLEAMASGCAAVLLADTAISREVGGSVATYFVPGTSDSLKEQLEDLSFLSREDRSSRIQRAREWAHQFTWSRTARQTRNAYEEVLGCHK